MADSPTIAERFIAIEMLLIDVDGVLTDGRIIYTDEGVELKAFHVRDGTGIKIWLQQGKLAALVTGRRSRAVDLRAAELGITMVVQGVADKFAAYQRLLADSNVQNNSVCAIGDDLPDLPVLNHCGCAVAVADACPEVKATAHYVTRARGGHAAVREVIELILQAQNRWPGSIKMKN